MTAGAPLLDRSFIQLAPGKTADNWSLHVDASVSTGHPDRATLFGGAGLAAAVEALERATDRPTIWATAQFLSFAYRGATLDIEATTLVAGRYTTQARATLRDGDREILNVAASLGSRPDGQTLQWVEPPKVSRPRDCDPMPIHWQRADDDMHSRLDIRVARGWHEQAGDDSGRATIWVRARDGVAVDRPLLAMLGDFLPAALSYALDKPAMTSLDNSVRFLTLAATEWVLCDIRLYGIAGGFGHGRVLMFAEDGTALAAAGQSVILRSGRHAEGSS